MAKSKRKAKKAYSPKRLARGAIDYARNVRWKWDCDYLDKLSPAEREWYEKFSEGFIAADSYAMADWPDSARRETYQQKNAANRDLYSVSNSVDLLMFPQNPNAFDGVEAGRDWDPAPLHLDDPMYRGLRAELREAIDARPRDPERIATLRRKLEIFVDGQDD